MEISEAKKLKKGDRIKVTSGFYRGTAFNVTSVRQYGPGKVTVIHAIRKGNYRVNFGPHEIEIEP